MIILRSTFINHSIWSEQFYRSHRNDGPFTFRRFIFTDIRYIIGGVNYNYAFALEYNHKEIFKKDII